MALVGTNVFSPEIAMEKILKIALKSIEIIEISKIFLASLPLEKNSGVSPGYSHGLRHSAYRHALCAFMWLHLHVWWSNLHRYCNSPFIRMQLGWEKIFFANPSGLCGEPGVGHVPPIAHVTYVTVHRSNN